MADRLPFLNLDVDADVAGDGVDVRGTVGAAADGGVDDDGVVEGGAGEDLAGLQIFAHHGDNPAAGFVGHLGALAMGGRDGGAARQGHA